MRLKSLDLIGAGVISVLTLVTFISRTLTGATDFPAWFLPFGILMALFIPGYTLTLAILPQMDRATILLLSLGISISMDIMGGLILNYTPWGLQSVSWAVWLSCISLLGCIIAVYHRSLLPKATATRSAIPRLDWKVIASFFLSGILIIVAIIIARNSAIQAGTVFTQLWAIPGTDDNGYTIQIGIRNQELYTMQYKLYVDSRGATLNQWPDIVLAPGEAWTISMPLMEKPQYPITFLLYETDTPDKVYRMVHLAPISFDKIVPSPAGQ